MAGLSTLWRRSAGVLMALLLSVLVVGPALDAALCECDRVTIVSDAGADRLSASIPADGADPDDLGGCVLGHCQHAPYSVPSPVVIATEPRFEPQRHVALQAMPLMSEPTFGLKRPPRA